MFFMLHKRPSITALMLVIGTIPSNVSVAPNPCSRLRDARGFPSRFAVRLDVAKLNLMLSSDCSQIGTGSSNSPRSRHAVSDDAWRPPGGALLEHRVKDGEQLAHGRVSATFFGLPSMHRRS